MESIRPRRYLSRRSSQMKASASAHATVRESAIATKYAINGPLRRFHLDSRLYRDYVCNVGQLTAHAFRHHPMDEGRPAYICDYISFRIRIVIVISRFRSDIPHARERVTPCNSARRSLPRDTPIIANHVPRVRE